MITKLVQILDAALADTARRSGDWLVCKPGCTQCCVGVFAIHQLDAARLQQGLQELSASDPERARSVRERARKSVERLAEDFPGDPATGLLDPSEEAEARFEDFANDEPCAALDPVTGLCDLYLSRPMTCRVFGPPVRSEQGLGRLRALLSRRHGGADCRLRNAGRSRGAGSAAAGGV